VRHGSGNKVVSSDGSIDFYRGLAEMSGQELCFRMISSRRPDTEKCPRHQTGKTKYVRSRVVSSLEN